MWGECVRWRCLQNPDKVCRSVVISSIVMYLPEGVSAVLCCAICILPMSSNSFTAAIKLPTKDQAEKQTSAVLQGLNAPHCGVSIKQVDAQQVAVGQQHQVVSVGAPFCEKGMRARCTKGRAVWCMAMHGMALIKASCT
jgi:hypothetical protein